jgi:hypothetical protein
MRTAPFFLLAAAAGFAGTAMTGVTFIPGGKGTVAKTALFNQAGDSLHTWSSVGSPYAAFLTDSGSVIYSTGSGTGPGAPYKSLAEVDWSGTNLHTWTWTSPTSGTLHHAHSYMPNGHYLALGYELLTNAGVKDSMTRLLGIASSSVTYTGAVYNEHILEFDPATNKVVWDWSAWKHFSASASPRKININKFGSSSSGPGGGSSGDVMHFNSVAYDPVHDLIMVSAHMMNEVLVIDHSSTPSDTTSGKYKKGGDILFRWGAPTNYGGKGSTVCNVVHGGNFVPPTATNPGNLLFFCNSDNGTLFSTASGHSVGYEIQPVLADTGFLQGDSGYKASVAFDWYSTTGSYESSGNFGFVQRLANGNTVISFSKSGRMVEVADGANVLEYTGCSSQTFRASRYPTSYPGISRLTSIYTGGSTGVVDRPAATGISLRTSYVDRTLRLDGLEAGSRIRVSDISGRTRWEGAASKATLTVPMTGWTNGTYLVRVESSGAVVTKGLGLFL